MTTNRLRTVAVVVLLAVVVVAVVWLGLNLLNAPYFLPTRG